MKINELDFAGLLPFLGEEEIYRMARAIAEGEEAPEGVSLEDLLPFLDEDQVDAILMKMLEKGKDITPCAPFASEAFFDMLVDRFIAGELEDINIDELYPFMSEETIKKLFHVALQQRKKDREAGEALIWEMKAKGSISEREAEEAAKEAIGQIIQDMDWQEMAEELSQRPEEGEKKGVDPSFRYEEFEANLEKKIEKKVREKMIERFLGRRKPE